MPEGRIERALMFTIIVLIVFVVFGLLEKLVNSGLAHVSGAMNIIM